MTRIPMGLVALFLFACGPGNNNPECSDNPGPGEVPCDPDCTGDECNNTDGYGYIGGEVDIEGDEVVCQVAAYEGENLYDVHFTDDGSTIQVPAGDPFTVCAGNPNITDTDGDPIHTEPDDTRWVAPCVTETPGDGETVDPKFSMNRYFRIENASCYYELYSWNGNDWEFFDLYDLTISRVEVKNGGDVVASSSFGTAELDNYLVTRGNTFFLTNEPDDAYLDDIMINQDGFVVSLVYTGIGKHKVTCTGTDVTNNADAQQQKPPAWIDLTQLFTELWDQLSS